MTKLVELDFVSDSQAIRVCRFAESIVEAYANGNHAIEAKSHCRGFQFFILSISPSYSLPHAWVSSIDLTGEQFFKRPVLIETRLVEDVVTLFGITIGETATIRHWPSEPSKTDPGEVKSRRSSWSPSLYFIQAESGGPVKIGLANCIESRIELFQVGCPYRLVCIGMIPNGSRRLEMDLHERFAKTRLHGEWFSDSAELQEFISANAISQ